MEFLHECLVISVLVSDWPVMYQHVQGKAKHCQEINDKLPDSYAEIIVKAMSVDKTKRHQSMDELNEVLDSVTL